MTTQNSDPPQEPARHLTTGIHQMINTITIQKYSIQLENSCEHVF